MNELEGNYDSTTYHVNSTRSVLVRLDGKLLRVSRPERNVFKHSFFNDPTLSDAEPRMCGQSIYDLTNAKVIFVDNIRDRDPGFCQDLILKKFETS